MTAASERGESGSQLVPNAAASFLCRTDDLSRWEADVAPIQCFPVYPLASWNEGERRWSELAPFCSASPTFPYSSPVLAFPSFPLRSYTQELGLISFSSYLFLGGHRDRNSSYDPSVSTFSSAKGKTPAASADVWQKCGWFCSAGLRGEMRGCDMIVFLKRSILSPYLKTILVWVCQPRADSAAHVRP